MSDKMTPQQRHRCMSRIRSNDTKPEMIVRKWLWESGFRYRLHVKSLPGTPDIVIRKLNVVIFINGCFWHGHIKGECYRPSKSNVDFWETKIKKNRERDVRNYTQLKSMGWKVFVVWECQLSKKHRTNTLNALVLELSRILLEKHGAKLYDLNETNETFIAAESDGFYYKNSKHSK